MERIFRKHLFTAAFVTSLAVFSPGALSAETTVQSVFQDLASFLQQANSCHPPLVLVTGASVYGDNVENGSNVNYIVGEFRSVNGNVLKGTAKVYQLQNNGEPPQIELSPTYPMTLTLNDKDHAFLQVTDSFGSGVADSGYLSLNLAFGGAPNLFSGISLTGTMSVAFSKGSINVCLH